MRGVTIDEGRLELGEHPDPEPGAGELLVAVEAAGLNGADMIQRRGDYPAPPGWPSDIPGMELAGTVVADRPARSSLATGDRVMAVVGGGAGRALHAARVHRDPGSVRCPDRMRAASGRCSRPRTTRCSPSAGSRSANAC